MKENELLNLMNELAPQDLLLLPGIGTVLTDRILAARPFTSLAELENVPGITFGRIRKLLKIEERLFHDIYPDD